VLAREDADLLAIGSRIITHHNPIVPAWTRTAIPGDTAWTLTCR